MAGTANAPSRIQTCVLAAALGASVGLAASALAWCVHQRSRAAALSCPVSAIESGTVPTSAAVTTVGASPPLPEYVVDPHRVLYITDAVACTRAIDEHFVRRDVRLVGLDAEWRPSASRTSVALLQLSTCDVTLLVHLAAFAARDGVPPALAALLANERVVFVGVAIDGDVKRLAAAYGLRVASTRELQTMAASRRVTRPGGPSGLRALAAATLGRAMAKAKAIQLSDWEAVPLSSEQRAYAAADSEASLCVYLALAALPVGAPAAHASEGSPRGNEADVGLDGAVPSRASESEPGGVAAGETSDGSPASRRTRDRGRSGASSRAVPETNHIAYDNCKLLRPSGTLMCYCSRRKIVWYIGRGLAEEVDAQTARLLFEPQLPTRITDTFYFLERRNECVVCGSEHQLNRRHLIPAAYRKNFARTIHATHDILAVCESCHALAERADRELREQIAAELGLDPYPELAWKRTGGRASARARTLLAELTRSRANETRRQCHIAVLRRELADLLGVPLDELTMATIEATAALTATTAGVRSHGDEVYAHLGPDGVVPFVRRWREHFVSALQPRFLPAGWSVDGFDLAVAQAAVLAAEPAPTEPLALPPSSGHQS